MLTSFVSAQTIEIDSCQYLNQPGATYLLTSDILEENITPNCINIKSPNIVFDCQGNSIINTNLSSNLINSNQANITIKNCILIGNRANTNSKAILLTGQRSNVYNNSIYNSYWGIDVRGQHNTVSENYVSNSYKAFHILYSNNHVIKNNYAKYSHWGFGLWGGEENQFINNKAYKNNFNLMLNLGEDTDIICGNYKTGKDFDIYLYTGANFGTKAYNVLYDPLNSVNDNEMTNHDYDCSTMDCSWVGEKCIPYSNDECMDNDGDGFSPYKITCYSGDDCNDNNAEVNPGAEDICGNGIDEDCDGMDNLCPNIENCLNINQPGEYYLTQNLMGSDVTANCININANDVDFDCKGFSIINNELKAPLIRVASDRVNISNCNLSASLYRGYFNNEYPHGGVGISSIGNNGIFEDNIISKTAHGIFLLGNNNIVNKNKFIDNIYGVELSYMSYSPISNNDNIIKNNFIKSISQSCEPNTICLPRIQDTIGIRSVYGDDNQFVNNKVINGMYGLHLYRSYNDIIKCGYYTSNLLDLYSSNSYETSLFGVIYDRIDLYDYSEEPYNCKTVECRWFDEDCLIDSDWDNVPDNEDLCLDTPEIEQPVVYGCSCSQILELKPGENKGELKNGCSQGTIEIFTKAIGWAKDLF